MRNGRRETCGRFSMAIGSVKIPGTAARVVGADARTLADHAETAMRGLQGWQTPQAQD
jgi:hypothetical protein